MAEERFEGEPLRGVHVLVVEDDPDSRELIKAVLEYAGALVTVAPSARAALGALASVRPDVLVSDIEMPGEDGYWLIQQVRSRPHVAGVPALALTAMARREDRRKALEAGFQEHLAKPVDPWELCRAVARLAGHG